MCRKMVKINIFIKTVAVACLIVIFSILALNFYPKTSLSEKDFHLEVALDKTVFNVGEKIYFNATIINKSGKDVNMSSNGAQPWVFFYNVNDDTAQGETCLLVEQIFKANEKITRSFEYEAIDAGTYILDAHYSIIVDNVTIKNKLDKIIIEVK